MIGKTLKYLRSKKKLNQDQVAKLLDIERTTLSGYEIERRQPDFETIEKIANNCGYKIFFINEETKDKFQVKDLTRKDI
ncbi:MAG: helix-turn-helix domain-containing protein [Bacilli bacterium]